LKVARRTAQSCGSGPAGLCPREHAALDVDHVDQPVKQNQKGQKSMEIIGF